MLDIVFLTGTFRPDVGAVIRGTNIETADLVKQLTWMLSIKLPPESICSSDQWNIGRFLILRESDDPGKSV
jgi:hypothetical protein